MPEIMTAALIADAAQTGRPLSAFDVITLEHAEAIVQAAEKSSAPVILQVSRSTVSYHGGALRSLAAALRAIAGGATVPVALHLDLVDTAELMRHGAAVGVSSIELDVHCLSYEERIANVSRAARWLSANNVFRSRARTRPRLAHQLPRRECRQRGGAARGRFRGSNQH